MIGNDDMNKVFTPFLQGFFYGDEKTPPCMAYGIFHVDPYLDPDPLTLLHFALHPLSGSGLCLGWFLRYRAFELPSVEGREQYTPGIASSVNSGIFFPYRPLARIMMYISSMHVLSEGTQRVP
jgi:hypothetical protein